jgi:hypothetical protein
MPQIRPLHIPPLLLASVFTIGGMMPFWNAPGAIRSFGLPEHIANSKAAQTCFTVYSSRMTAWGIGMWTFWFRNNLKAIDTMLSLLLYVGAVDGYVCWKEGVPSKSRTVQSFLWTAGWRMGSSRFDFLVIIRLNSGVFHLSLHQA